LQKAHKYILALDPSGAYNEGKGTTGWTIINAHSMHVAELGTLCAAEFASDLKYWAEHISLIKDVMQRKKDVAVAIEDYFLYAQYANAHVNSRFETCQLIGALKMACYDLKLPHRMQTAAEVKPRWTDEILLHKNIIYKLGAAEKLNTTTTNIPIRTKHELDCIRHGIHYATFYNEKEA
jgi:Holliday junction resolvasome RuvABC endonuclease subunit